MVQLTPEIVSVNGKNLSTEDESDDDDGDYFDSDAWASPLPSPVEDSDEWTPNPYDARSTPTETNLRRSNRTADRTRYAQNFCAMQFVSDNPICVKDTMSSENSVEWRAAKQEEIDVLMANNTWVLTNFRRVKKL